MPEPKPNEPREDFMDRCTPQVIAEGREADQAVAICSGLYGEESKKQATWKAFDRRRAGYLSYGTDVFSRALRKQAEPYFNMSSFQDNVEISKEPLTEAFRTVYTRVARAFGRESFDSLKSAYPEITRKAFEAPENWSQLVEDWLQVNTFDIITNVTDTTRDGIQRLITRSMEQGLSIDDFSKLLKENYYVSKRRGRVIARTEIIRASNFGAQEGAKATGIPMQKQWVATRDGRTREDHVNADGQTSGELEGKFLVGGEQCEYPGDPVLSAGNSVNCRCVVTYKPYRR